MKNRLRDRTFLSLLLLCFVAMLVIELAMFALTFNQEMMRSQERTDLANAQSVENVCSYLDGLIQEEITLGERVRNSSWAIKLNSNTTVFDEQFTYLRKSEIMEDFLFDVSTDDIISSRTVYFKGRGLAVSKTKWCSVEYYLRSIGVPRESYNQVLYAIENCTVAAQQEILDDAGNSVTGKNILFTIPLKIGSGSSSSVFLCTILNTNSIIRNIEKMLPQSIAGLHVYHGNTGRLLMSIGDMVDDERAQSIVSEISRAGWRAEFLVDESVVYVNPQAIRDDFVAYLFMVLLAAFVAFLLANITYHPVQQLLKKLAPNTAEKNAYRAIEDTIDTMVNKLSDSRKADAMRQLLAGYFGTAREVEHDVPFRDDMAVRVLILANEDHQFIEYAIVDGMRRLLEAETGICFEISEALNKSVILAIGAESERELHVLSRKIIDFTAQQHWQGHVFAGDISAGLIGVSISYQSAQGKQQYLFTNASSRYYFPFEWESQLLMALRQEKMMLVEDIFRELLSENNRLMAAGKMSDSDMMLLINHVASDIRRSVQELGLGESALPLLNQISAGSTYEEMWALLHEAASEICSCIRQRQEMGGDVDKRIVAYIDEHFTDANMGITVLQEQFGLSANTINKSIRALTGQTFSPYLIQRRMEKAKELLRDPNLKIPTIAQMVGYDNDYSFRRTFLRYTGRKVQEYREEMGRGQTENEA